MPSPEHPKATEGERREAAIEAAAKAAKDSGYVHDWPTQEAMFDTWAAFRDALPKTDKMDTASRAFEAGWFARPAFDAALGGEAEGERRQAWLRGWYDREDLGPSLNMRGKPTLDGRDWIAARDRLCAAALSEHPEPLDRSPEDVAAELGLSAPKGSLDGEHPETGEREARYESVGPDDLKPGDVIEIWMCIENDEWDWEPRTVVAVESDQIVWRGGGREYPVDRAKDAGRRMRRKLRSPEPRASASSSNCSGARAARRFVSSQSQRKSKNSREGLLDALIFARSELHRAMLERRSTDGYGKSFKRINAAIAAASPDPIDGEGR